MSTITERSSVSDPDGLKKWLLWALCVLATLWIAFLAVDNFGLGGRPWFGWFDAFRDATRQPYALVFRPRAGGATERAGIRDGDVADARAQSWPGRVVLLSQPPASQPTILVVRRGLATFSVRLVGSTMWEGEAPLKFFDVVTPLIEGLWFVACAALITQRRWRSPHARTLALILCCVAPGFFVGTRPVFPSPVATLLGHAAMQALGMAALLLMVDLTSSFGIRTALRRMVEAFAYVVIAVAVIFHAAFYVGAFTLRIDPVPFWPGGRGVSAVDVGAALAVVIVAGASVASTQRERTRVAWLLLPLPVALSIAAAFSYFAPFANTWAAAMAVEACGIAAMLVGALAVTYALLKRHVLDFGFVLSRTLVVAILSLIVVVAFVLLEWLLGTIVSGASHATGLIANGALALALGLSLRYIHTRVDALVDRIFFSKRHADERSLRDFALEASYVTEPGALLDCAIGKIEHHTDATSAALLLREGGAYVARRFFGNGTAPHAGENDPAILALKAWHKPVDPHHYQSALHGAVAVPMLARGRLLGVILLDERPSGEAYAPDEVDALMHVAHGVASALDGLDAAPLDGDLRSRLDEIRSLLVQVADRDA